MRYKCTGIIILCFTLLGGTACRSESSVEEFEPPPPSSTIAELTDAPTGVKVEPTVSASKTSEATARAGGGAIPDPPPTSLSPAKAQVLTNLNLRAGPGTNYAVVGSLPARAEVTVTGRNEESTWLLGIAEDGDRVWLTADPELVEADPQAVAALPVVEVPPLPYNANNVDVNNVLYMIPLVLHNPNSFTCASNGGLNNTIIRLAEGNVIGPHSGDFVHVELGNVLFKYTGGSWQLIRENPIARFDGGAESLPLAIALQMFERREIVWNGQFGDWPGRGVTGCDKSAGP